MDTDLCAYKGNVVPILLKKKSERGERESENHFHLVSKMEYFYTYTIGQPFTMLLLKYVRSNRSLDRLILYWLHYTCKLKKFNAKYEDYEI